MDTTNIFELVKKADNLKPQDLKMNPLKWKFLVRSAARGKNIMMTGPSGCGKTFAVQQLVKAINTPFFYFNLGATQDPRTTLIGNTQFEDGKGTFFNQSEFIKAIQTKGAVILLDELSRAHPEAWNILMTILDQGQRYLRIDEDLDSPTIKVADGVSFIATANIGNEYTSTRMMDRAILDRFVTIEMETLTLDQELDLLKLKFDDVDETLLRAIADISSSTRKEVKSEDARISDSVSTRMSVEMAELLQDGFTLIEAAEVCVYPFFPEDGGVDSERTFVKSLVQKYAELDNTGSTDELFDLSDVDSDDEDW